MPSTNLVNRPPKPSTLDVVHEIVSTALASKKAPIAPALVEPVGCSPTVNQCFENSNSPHRRDKDKNVSDTSSGKRATVLNTAHKSRTLDSGVTRVNEDLLANDEDKKIQTKS